MVQARESFLIGSLARPLYLRPQRDLGDRLPPWRYLLQHALSVVVVGRDREPRHAGEMQERQHVATRESRDEHFLRIYGGLDRPLANDMRRSRRRHRRPAVEAYCMRAAEATLKELLAALLRRPFDLCSMGRHRFTSPVARS